MFWTGFDIMEIRELGIDDLREIKKAMLAIFSGDPWNDRWTDRQLDIYVRELIGAGNSLSFGLYECGSLIGISLGRVKHWYEGTEYWIDEFGILSERQGNGAGSYFLGKIEKILREKEIYTVVLLTERNMPAYRFYKNNGFTEQKNSILFSKQITGF